jgi:hypothetical protein
MESAYPRDEYNPRPGAFANVLRRMRSFVLADRENFDYIRQISISYIDTTDSLWEKLFIRHISDIMLGFDTKYDLKTPKSGQGVHIGYLSIECAKFAIDIIDKLDDQRFGSLYLQAVPYWLSNDKYNEWRHQNVNSFDPSHVRQVRLLMNELHPSPRPFQKQQYEFERQNAGSPRENWFNRRLETTSRSESPLALFDSTPKSQSFTTKSNQASSSEYSMKRSATKTSLNEESSKMMRHEIEEIENSDEKIIKQETQRSTQETQQIDSSQTRNQLNEDIIVAIEIQIITLQALVTKLKGNLAPKK